MKTINTLIDDIYNVLDKGAEPTEKYVKELSDNLSKIIADTIRNYQKERKGTLRMSNVGRPCTRQLWYEANGEKGEDLPPPLKLRFMYGNVVEEILLYLAKEAGHTVTHEQEEVELHGIKGHMDAVIDDVVVDVKSASSYAFNKFKDGTLADNDSFGYIAQISGYAKALNKNQGAFLAMDKNSGELALLKVNTDIMDIDEKVKTVKALVNSPELPSRSFRPEPDGMSGNMKLGSSCRYCGFKRSCYPEVRAFKYSNGMKYLTKVVKVPNVEEVKDF
jgi:hypothetical protein